MMVDETIGRRVSREEALQIVDRIARDAEEDRERAAREEHLRNLDYDSRPDTYAHILEVNRRLNRFIAALLQRGTEHDMTKLEDPELEYFDRHTPELAGLEYGSEEYRECLRKMKPAIDHHQARNRHHPEHFAHGMRDMNLVDLVELLADWCSAAKRHHTGNVRKSIAMNQQRFGYSDDLRAILENTVDILEGS